MSESLVAIPSPNHVVTPGLVLANRQICREHYRLTFRVDAFPPAAAGQFVHIGPQRDELNNIDAQCQQSATGTQLLPTATIEPFLRKAFSITGLRRTDGGVEIDVIYRVVGTLTRWLESLAQGDFASLLGPQGNRFPIEVGRSTAWLVAGGVGLPPLQWLVEALHAANRQAVFFYGAQRIELVALSMSESIQPAKNARTATLAATELTAFGVPVVISTDDGSLGFPGHIGQALEEFHSANPIPGGQLVLYTCGPEKMMAFVAKFAASLGAACYACVERSMACATGMCQSCVVPVHDPMDADGWRYRLCCTDGPVFDASEIIWDR